MHNDLTFGFSSVLTLEMNFFLFFFLYSGVYIIVKYLYAETQCIDNNKKGLHIW